jgi:hypothetical protein
VWAVNAEYTDTVGDGGEHRVRGYWWGEERMTTMFNVTEEARP